MANTKPTPEEMRQCLSDSRMACDIITDLCDADISGIRSEGIDLACNIKWLAGLQEDALKLIERGIGA